MIILNGTKSNNHRGDVDAAFEKKETQILAVMWRHEYKTAS